MATDRAILVTTHRSPRTCACIATAVAAMALASLAAPAGAAASSGAAAGGGASGFATSGAAPGAPAARAPVGWDAYRRLDLLALLRPGERARLASSYDRRGGNQDTTRFACRRRAGGRCVVAEHVGPGEVDSIWTTRPRAGDVRATGTIRVELDGRAVLDAPLADVVAGRLGPPFAFPAVADRRRASGGVWIKVPMPFRERMTISTSRNPGYVRVNHRAFDAAAGVETFDPSDPAPDVLAALRGEAPPPAGGDVEGPSLDVPGPATISHLRIRLARRPSARDLRDTRVRMTFDGRRTVDAPLGELFGSGLPARVRSLMARADGAGSFASRWPMPLRQQARISLSGPVRGSISATLSRDPALPDALARGDAGYFHATSRRRRTAPGRPWRVLHARGPGLLVGVSATLEGPRSQRHLEGDERIVADGALLHGTGTEDFFEGGFYWHFGPRSHPLVGSPAHVAARPVCPRDCRSMYRWLVADAVPFRSRLRFDLEHGDRNRVAGTYSTTALWYAS
jgi:hypothetical protein